MQREIRQAWAEEPAPVPSDKVVKCAFRHATFVLLPATGDDGNDDVDGDPEEGLCPRYPLSIFANPRAKVNAQPLRTVMPKSMRKKAKE